MGIWDEELDDDEEDDEEDEEQPQNAPLVDRILKSFVSSNFHDPARDYLPEGCLKDLVTQSAIATELHSFDGEFRSLPEDKKKKKIQKMNCDIEYREELATWILKNAPRTFAVALQCESDPILLVIAMSIFRDNNFTDESLPIPDLMPSTKIFPPAIWTSSVKLWTPVKIHNFYEKQWKCLVPVFSCAKYDHDLLYDNYIFPFTKVGAAPKVGAFSFVHRVVIRDDHQRHVNMEQWTR
ncbi:hypothetical protein BU25DRAFT_229810 [Macroventuria anomochaeta]|uniref:Uncharacterized protein n=1 Tax=Macroventuria anomochaeta TaxID=301207 RepID=A0ACB6RJ54_9PLEO|nr:uncharacterized protein BU25DRAFT_229810 [Macroventuria anomochaeta]KAF2621901.1 hypothetical protein BU25DRAFT_229810 [Macroventuria anomochaeta]